MANPTLKELTQDPNYWMQGFPPTKEQIVRFNDGSYYDWPKLRWSFSNIQQLVPTKSFWCGPKAARELRQGPTLNLDNTAVTTTFGETFTWQDTLTSTCTDAIAVLHAGELVYEAYFGASSPSKPHILQSANKSFVGTIAECLIDEGKLDEYAPVTDLIPELAQSAWADATVRQVMDMQINMAFHEDYTDPKSEIWRFLRAMGMAPSKSGATPESIADVLPNIQSGGAHGEVFAYREPNIFVLGWLVRRASNKDLATLVSEKIWQPMGAERDGYYMLDDAGSETTCSTTLRDLVRFGELMRLQGKVGDKQVIPKRAIDRIFAGGDLAKFARAQPSNPKVPTLKNWSYRSQWWVRHLQDRICPVARGAHGQVLYIDPANELVIARFGSNKQSPSSALDHIMWPMVDLITEQVLASKE